MWSGGIDSTGLIYILLKQYSCDVYPIFLRHGQRNLKFEESAIDYYSKKFQDFPKFQKPFIANSDIPALEFKEIEFKDRHLLRNSDLVNNAVRYALYKKIDTVLISTYSTDIQDGRLE